MTYTAKTVKELRSETGSPLKKLADELTNIDTEIDTVESTANAAVKVVSGALTADVSGNYAFTWQNPESTAILVHRVIIDVTTAGGTATSILDVGVVANATSTAADIINDLDLDAAAVTDHMLVAGTGLGGVHKVDENGGDDDYITGKILTKDASALVGSYYIMYTKTI